MWKDRTDKAWGVSNSAGMLNWPVRAMMRCLDWWIKNGNGCSVCIRVCPWNKPNNYLHKLVRPLAERRVFPKLIVYFDQSLGFSTQYKDPLFAAVESPSVMEVDSRNERQAGFKGLVGIALKSLMCCILKTGTSPLNPCCRKQSKVIQH